MMLVMLTGFNPREGREMHLMNSVVIAGNNVSFNPREGREMHLCIEASRTSAFTGFNPREGREMHLYQQLVAAIPYSFQSP